MRGLSSAGGNTSVVGFYLDETALSSPASAQFGKVIIDPNLYDLNRVEILRGPQGTLYGSSSMGGTVKVCPTLRSWVSSPSAARPWCPRPARAEARNFTQNGMVNLPLGTDVALRIVGRPTAESGWVKRFVFADGACSTMARPAPVRRILHGAARGNGQAVTTRHRSTPSAPRCSGVRDDALPSPRHSCGSIRTRMARVPWTSTAHRLIRRCRRPWDTMRSTTRQSRRMTSFSLGSPEDRMADRALPGHVGHGGLDPHTVVSQDGTEENAGPQAWGVSGPPAPTTLRRAESGRQAPDPRDRGYRNATARDSSARNCA